MRGISLRLSRWLHEPKKVEHFWRISLSIVVAIGVLIPFVPTHAFGATEAVNYLLTFLAFILQWIIIMLGNLVLFLVDLVIQVAQYNTFVRAQPVQTGWPIIRDVINMFFIVVLLLSAFSTIIGYDKYHYKNIIKKFFLMAVLVNFSLPLFGVAIDFSQVLMLTFVNGFRAAAAGNFVTVLKLDQVMKINANAINLSADNGTNPIENPMVQKVTAMMFGVFILGISATILAIMVVYLVARIVGLWILLITSPGALFVTGLPSSLSGKIPGFGNEWWNKLWTLLTGGPIMAFFLWLTLATASNIGPTFTQAQYSGTGEVQAAQNYFQTAIGNVESLGTYIVAIVMLFTGLSAAVSTSSAVAPAVGKAAGKIRDYGVGSTKFLAYGGAAAAGAYGARQVGGAIGEAGAGLDRRWGVTKGFGTAMQTVGVKLGSEGLAAAGAKVAGTRGRAVKKEQEKFESMTKGFSTGKRMDLAKSRMASLLSNSDERKALSEGLTKDAFTFEGQKHLLGQYEKETKKAFGERPGDEAGQKIYDQKVDAYKKMRLSEDRQKMLTAYQTAAGENEDKLKWINDRKEATPSHIEADKLRGYISGKMGDDPTYFRKVKAEDFENSAVLTSLMASAGYNGNELRDRDGIFGKAMLGNDKKAQLLRAMESKLTEKAGELSRTTGRTVTVQELLEDESQLKSLGLTDAYFVKDENDPNKHRMVMKSELGTVATEAVGTAAAPGAAPVVVTGAAIRNEEEILANQRAIERTRAAMASIQERPAGPDRDMEMAGLHQELFAAQQGMIAAGAPVGEVFRADTNGRFQTPEDQRAYEMSVQNVFTEGKKDFKTYSKVDMSVVNKNPEGTNDARRAMIRHTNVNDLGTAYMDANAAKDKSSRKNIAEIARAIDTEGSRHQGVIDQYNQGAAKLGKPMIDMKEITAAAKDYQSANTDVAKHAAEYALKNATKGSGVSLDIDDAIAIAKRQEVLADPVLQHYTRHATGRVAQAVGRGKDAIRESTQPIREVVSDATAHIAEKTGGVVRATGRGAQATGRFFAQRPKPSTPEIEDASGMTPTKAKGIQERATKHQEEVDRNMQARIDEQNNLGNKNDA